MTTPATTRPTDTPLSDTLAAEAAEESPDLPQELQDRIEATDLSDAPELKPYLQLRARQRLPIVGLIDSMGEITDTSTLSQNYELLAEIDEALEQVAVDPAAYAAWVVGADSENRLIALFLRWSEVTSLGEAGRSAS